MDHYYPPPEIQELELTQPLPARVAQCVGEYSSLQRSFTSLTKLAAIMDTVSVRVDTDGYLRRGNGPRKWAEVEPLLFQESKGQRRLAFRADAAGNITHLLRSPDGAFVKLRWYETSTFHYAVAGISLLVMLSALVVWPIVAFYLRNRRRPGNPSRMPGWWPGAWAVFPVVLRMSASSCRPGTVSVWGTAHA